MKVSIIYQSRGVTFVGSGDYAGIGTDHSLKHQVYKAIKDDIIFGRLRSGEQLNMLELCNRMHISSAPIREALNMLSKEGLVDLTPRKRAVVATVQDGDIDTIIFLRSTLEPYAARLSIGKIPPERIQEMRAVLMGILDAPYQMEKYVASDLALHELLHQYAGSPLLSEIISNVKDRSIRLRYMAEHFSSGDPSDQVKVSRISTEEHLGILYTLEAKDGDLVYARVLQHIQNYNTRTAQAQQSGTP